jgi:hypothetical protein
MNESDTRASRGDAGNAERVEITTPSPSASPRLRVNLP